MRRHARVKKFITAAIVTGAVTWAMPTVAAQAPHSEVPAAPEGSSEIVSDAPAVPTPEPVEVASADLIDEVRAQLASLGVQTPAVDPALTDAVDEAIVTHIPNTRLPEKAPAADAPVAEDTVAEVTDRAAYADGEAWVDETEAALDQNYLWTDHPIDKVMAGKPFADWVLHRVPGSWFDAPRIPEESMVVQNQDRSLYGPGTPIFVGDQMMCTLGVVGTDAEGRKVGITAGHCGNPGDKVWSADSWQVGASGTVAVSNHLHDYSVIELGSNSEITRSYNGVTVNRLGGPVAPGQMLCKQGVATGNTCGHVWSADEALQISQVCAMVGDSGAPVLAGDRMVGMISGGVVADQRLSCKTPLQGGLFMPTVSTNLDNVLADMDKRGGVGAGFQLAN
ncbi:S1 family peptidase [Corynebacterium sp.]|uniref:S1 family peptidase n=1 Tax=Corynebacterium sp. TaxID=1720 RepID=UPI0026E08EAA|nr:serine protease [Corynebacterium sp.]MDO5513018.1 serine protease [Corynebacterium sp.]